MQLRKFTTLVNKLKYPRIIKTKIFTKFVHAYEEKPEYCIYIEFKHKHLIEFVDRMKLEAIF